MNKEYTKQRIWEAFYGLCTTMPFEKLTVESICREAGVSKATFYRHYLDKYDVMNYNSLAIAQRLVNWEKCSSWQDFLLEMCREIQREQEYYRRAFNTSGQNAHSRFLFEYSFGIVRECYLLSRKQGELDVQERYMIAHYCHGCVDILEEWLRNPDELSAQQIASIMYNAMPEALRGTWIKDKSIMNIKTTGS